MRLVIDTNKIAASLLKAGAVRRLLFHPRLQLYTPNVAINEIKAHREEFLEKVPRDVFDEILYFVLKKIIVIDLLEITNVKVLNHARKIAEKFDINDYSFIALSLVLNAPIWTNDKDLIKHSLTTGEYLAIDTQALRYMLIGKDATLYLKRKYLLIEDD